MAAYDIPEIEADDQDRAEVLDETNLTKDGENIANFDDIEDVFDVTTAQGDDDPDEDESPRDDGVEQVGKDEGTGLGPDDVEEDTDRDEEKRLEEGLKETFPASDPVSAKHIT